MSGEQPDLAVPPEALAVIAAGIDMAHAELKELGMIGEATTGRGFSDLALSGLELGHAGLTAQFETFCERWEWGVRALMQRGNGFASAIGLSAGAIHEQEQYVKDTFKIAVNSVNGNPHLSEEEVKAKRWAEISTQTPYDNADWSPESFSEVHGESSRPGRTPLMTSRTGCWTRWNVPACSTRRRARRLTRSCGRCSIRPKTRSSRLSSRRGATADVSLGRGRQGGRGRLRQGP